MRRRGLDARAGRLLWHSDGVLGGAGYAYQAWLVWVGLRAGMEADPAAPAMYQRVAWYVNNQLCGHLGIGTERAVPPASRCNAKLVEVWPEQLAGCLGQFLVVCFAHGWYSAKRRVRCSCGCVQG